MITFISHGPCKTLSRHPRGQTSSAVTRCGWHRSPLTSRTTRSCGNIRPFPFTRKDYWEAFATRLWIFWAVTDPTIHTGEPCGESWSGEDLDTTEDRERKVAALQNAMISQCKGGLRGIVHRHGGCAWLRDWKKICGCGVRTDSNYPSDNSFQ